MRSKWLEAGLGLAAAAWIALAIAGCTFHPGAAGGVTEVDGGSLPNAYACSCTCKVKASTPTLTVALSTDDAEENLNDLSDNLTDPVLNIANSAAAPLLIGLRFQNVPVPPGVTVQSAYVQFTAAAGNANAASFQWVGQASDDAATFGNGPGDLNGRPPTNAMVAWTPVPAWVAGESGAAERSPDLSPIIQEIVNRPGWRMGNALALGITGTGLRRAVAFDGNPAQAAQLILTFTVPGSTVSKTFEICMPDALNPSLNDAGVEPSGSDLANDCEMRVQTTLSDLDNACGYPSDCSCDVPTVSDNHYSNTCATPCAENPLDAGTCGNFDPNTALATATNVAGDQPVCGTASPITAEVFGQQSLCNVTGQVSFDANGDSASSNTRGEVEFSGTPCPGGSCSVGMSYLLDADAITFSNFFGSATFRNLAAVGETSTGKEALLASDGTGLFDPGATLSAGRGTRGSTSMALLGTNDQQVDVRVDWAGKSCHVSGTLVGSVDPELRQCESASPNANHTCTEDSQCGQADGCSGDNGACLCVKVGATDTSLGITLDGTLVNQPPAVNAGADQVVECNAPGEGIFTLAATGTDPDNNAHLYTWFKGGRTGATLGYAATMQQAQPVGTTQAYLVQLIDAHMQAAEDVTQVKVQDTTAPVISCNAPLSIGPVSRPVSIRATASDVCDPNATPVLSDLRCYRTNGSGKVIDLTHACDATFAGDTITITHTNGIDEHVQWTAQVTDASGNSSSTTCETVVGKQ